MYGVKKENSEIIIIDKILKDSKEFNTTVQSKEKTSFVIVDSQSVKNTDTTEEKRCDKCKKYLQLNKILY